MPFLLEETAEESLSKQYHSSYTSNDNTEESTSYEYNDSENGIWTKKTYSNNGFRTFRRGNASSENDNQQTPTYPDIMYRIVGGYDPLERPWMVLILNLFEGQQMCGGALLNHKQVSTLVDP